MLQSLFSASATLSTSHKLCRRWPHPFNCCLLLWPIYKLSLVDAPSFLCLWEENFPHSTWAQSQTSDKCINHEIVHNKVFNLGAETRSPRNIISEIVSVTWILMEGRWGQLHLAPANGWMGPLNFNIATVINTQSSKKALTRIFSTLLVPVVRKNHCVMFN